MPDQDPPPASASDFVQRLRARAAADATYGGASTPEAPTVSTRICPGCGATRPDDESLTTCSWCGTRYLDVTLSDGIHLSPRDNTES
jgi:hypothetical protein